MEFLKSIFSKSTPKTIFLDDLGEFRYIKNRQDAYWEIDTSVLNLPEKFSFGTISGTETEVTPDALICFKEYATHPHKLFALLSSEFYQLANEHLQGISSANVQNEFYVYSLTVSSGSNFEFGLHAKSKDILIETFVRDNTSTEVHTDLGCCDV